MLQAGSLVADILRSWDRHDLVFAAFASGDGGPAVGPRQRQKGPGVSGEGARPEPGAASSHGRRGLSEVPRTQMIAGQGIMSKLHAIGSRAMSYTGPFARPCVAIRAETTEIGPRIGSPAPVRLDPNPSCLRA